MNKKEKALVEIFEKSAKAANTYAEGSIWFFLGGLMRRLAMEATDNEEHQHKLFMKLHEIIKDLD